MLLVGDIVDMFDLGGINKVVISKIDMLHLEKPPVEVYNKGTRAFVNYCPSWLLFEQVERLVVRQGVLYMWYRGFSA